MSPARTTWPSCTRPSSSGARASAFRLCFVGGRAWGSEDFGRRVAELSAARRPIDVFSGVDDEFLAAAYELARFTVFPSFNEGFGLPVGESLALGTPVITANYGSMAEIAADGGALTVDPRDDHAIADAMRQLLTDDALLAELESQARDRPSRTWDDYARETWAVLVGDEGLIDPCTCAASRPRPTWHACGSSLRASPSTPPARRSRCCTSIRPVAASPTSPAPT